VLVTLKMREHVWNLRTQRAFDTLIPRFFAARERLGMRLVHFSIQRDHIHLIVEVLGTLALSRGVQGLSVRIARALNRMMKRRGAVFADRYHHRVLSTARQVRNALAYVLCNGRKHGHARGSGWLDPYSSARAFDGWSSTIDSTGPPLPVAAPRSWLLRVGWRHGGLVGVDHHPGAERISIRH
jgi:REP element-mobilizing transposase RayT